MIAHILKPIKDQSQNIVKDTKPVLDERWYDELKKIGFTSAIRLFEGNLSYRKRQFEDFIAGRIENPTLDYPLVDVEEISIRMDLLKDFENRILAEEENEVIKKVYMLKIREQLAKCNLVLAAGKIKRNKNNTSQLRFFAKLFKESTEYVYGYPKKNIFQWVVTQMRHELGELLHRRDGALGNNLIDDILNILPEYKSEQSFFDDVTEQDIAFGRKKIIERLIDLDKLGARENTIFQAEQIKEAFDYVLKKHKIFDWQAHISQKIAAITVSQKDKIIRIPRDRKMSTAKLYKIILHEIGTHVIRRANGENEVLKLLGVGLDRYEVGEEGIATISEKLYDINSFRKHRLTLMSYLSIGLIYGLDGKKRNFRETYELLEKIYFVFKLQKVKKHDLSLKYAQLSAWSRCVRDFRGTSCSLRGICNTKDLIYLDGKICIWNLIKAKSAEVDRFFIGKYNPCDSNHVEILNNLRM